MAEERIESRTQSFETIAEEWKEAKTRWYRESFADAWKKAFEGRRESAVTLIGPSAYLLELDGTRLVLDQVFRFPWIGELVEERWRQDLARTDGLLYSHLHGDHYMPSMVLALKDDPPTLFLPAFFNRQQLMDNGYPEEKIVTIEDGQPFTVGNLKITPFESLHTRVTATEHYPEYGFVVECSRGTLIFPVDVRDYKAEKLPSLPKADWLFLHVWLGGGNALNLPCEPYLSAFTQFAMHFDPAHISLAHLYEIGRTLPEMWTNTHAGLCIDSLLAQNPDLAIHVPKIGESMEI